LILGTATVAAILGKQPFSQFRRGEIGSRLVPVAELPAAKTTLPPPRSLASLLSSSTFSRRKILVGFFAFLPPNGCALR